MERKILDKIREEACKETSFPEKKLIKQERHVT